MTRSLIVCLCLLCFRLGGQGVKKGLKRKLPQYAPREAQQARADAREFAECSGASCSTDAFVPRKKEPGVGHVMSKKFLETKISAKDFHEKLDIFICADAVCRAPFESAGSGVHLWTTTYLAPACPIHEKSSCPMRQSAR